MSRRRSSMATFDLEPEEAAEPEDEAAPDDDPPSWGARVVARARRVRPRAWAVVAGVAAGAVVLAGAGAVTVQALTERHRLALLTAAPGGLLDVAATTDEADGWSLDTDTGVLAVLTGGTVVVRAGTDVVGVDVETGVPRWRHDLGAMVECGPTPWDPAEWGTPGTEVVCLDGEDTDRTATVIAADGTVVGQRDLGDVTDQVVAPAAGRTLLVVQTDGALPEPRRYDDEEAALRALRSMEVPAVKARFEDAVTGEVVGTAQVPFDADATDQCLTWDDDGVTIDLSGFSLRSSPDLIEYGRCGAHLVWALPGEDGGALETGTVADGWWRSAVSSVDGGVVLPLEGNRSLLTAVDDDADGEPLPGRLLDPKATDGTTGPRLVQTADGISALDPDDLAGDPLWVRVPDGGPSSDLMVGGDGTEVLVRTADTVVLSPQDGTLVGLDVRTGAERWRTAPAIDGWNEESWIAGALTDGREVLLVLGGSESTHVLARLDLATGDLLQQTDREGGLGWSPGTVDGHLLLRTVTGERSTIARDDGLLVHTDPGSLRGTGRA